ncbi:tail endopeptidase [Bacillus phage PSYJ-YH]|nr:tail endopeptidase [Bacillus phage PSYJ-YH]
MYFPILYESIEIMVRMPDGSYVLNPEFETLGLGVLSDVTYCEVYEQLSGEFTCKFTLPPDSRLRSKIKLGRYIKVNVTDEDTHIKNVKKEQLFRISEIDRYNILGGMNVTCEHMTYAQNGAYIHEYLANPYVDPDALNEVIPRNMAADTYMFELQNKAYKPSTTSSPMIPMSFDVSFRTKYANISSDIRGKSLTSALIDGAESALGIYGGDMLRDNNYMRFFGSVSEQNSEQWHRIDYGLNMSDMEITYDIDSVMTHMVPHAVINVPTNMNFIKDPEDVTEARVTEAEWTYEDVDIFQNVRAITLVDDAGVPVHEKYGYYKVFPVDLSGYKDILVKTWIGNKKGSNNDVRRSAVQKKIEEIAVQWAKFTRPWEVKLSCNIKYVPFWESNEYKDAKGVKRIYLGDYAKVFHPDIPFEVNTRCVSTTFDVLKNRITNVELSSEFNKTDNRYDPIDL